MAEGASAMSTGTAFLKNTWYVAAWSHEIAADGMLARTITRVPLLFWRDGAGGVVALDDRCCHRAAPLSKGRREGDNIRCMYHGLLFDKTGKCIEIPSQDFIPPAAKVRAYPLVVRARNHAGRLGQIRRHSPQSDAQRAQRPGGTMAARRRARAVLAEIENMAGQRRPLEYLRCSPPRSVVDGLG